MSRTSRGVTPTWPVSMRLIFDAEHSSLSPTSSMVSPAASLSRRSSLASRLRRTVGLLPLAMSYHLNARHVGQMFVSIGVRCLPGVLVVVPYAVGYHPFVYCNLHIGTCREQAAVTFRIFLRPANPNAEGVMTD